MKPMKKILFLDILSGDEKIKKEDRKTVYKGIAYGESVRRFLNIPKSNFFIVDAAYKKFPDITRVQMVIIGGSVENPIRGSEAPWIKKTYLFINKLKEENVPVFGMCGGLQFTVRALGGDIVKNKNGRDFGNENIVLTKEGEKDYLFRGIRKKFIAMESHWYVAEKMLPGWRLLGSSKKTKIEAIAIGDRIRLTQFHPEMAVSHIRAIGRMREAALQKEGFGGKKGVGTFLSSIQSTDVVGRRILKNFIRQWEGSLQTLPRRSKLKK